MLLAAADSARALPGAARLRSVSDGLLRNRSRRAIFLCYHSIAPEGPRYLTISADLFERQLDLLRRRGYRSGGIDELAEAAAGRGRRRTVFLTFDDGFRDNYETALPLLREYGFGAFVFPLVPLLEHGGPLEWPEVAADRDRYPGTMRSLTWEMLGEMCEGGFEVGSHTLTHPHLPELSEAELREQLERSRAALVERLGSCETIAYPFGEWSPRVAAAAAGCGYRYAFSLPSGSGQRHTTAHSIPRLNVDYRDEPRRFAAKLSPLGRRLLLSPAVGTLRKLRD